MLQGNEVDDEYVIHCDLIVKNISLTFCYDIDLYIGEMYIDEEFLNLAPLKGCEFNELVITTLKGIPPESWTSICDQCKTRRANE